MPNWRWEDLPQKYRQQVQEQLSRNPVAHSIEVGDGGVSSLDITLPIDLPSRNAVDGLHWSNRQRLRQSFVEALMVAGVCFAQNERHSRRSLQVQRILGPGQRVFDHDNLVGGAKQLIDALVHCGWAVDDSPEWLVVGYGQDVRKRDEGPAVRLTLADA